MAPPISNLIDVVERGLNPHIEDFAEMNVFVYSEQSLRWCERVMREKGFNIFRDRSSIDGLPIIKTQRFGSPITVYMMQR
jgi:hypothetical protein